MAAIMVGAINNYIGTAAEMTGMTTTYIPQGSTFFASDTGWRYILVGTSWIKVLTPAS